MEIEIETSTDTVEQVKEALGSAVEIEESPAEEEAEKPAAKPAKAAPKQGKEAPAEEEPEAEEGNEEEPGEEEAAKPAKKAAPTVPIARLNEEIRKRRALEKQLQSRNTAEEEPEEEAEPERPQSFSGKPEPTIEEFMKDVDKFDPEATAKASAGFTKAYGVWAREEARAEAAYNTQVEKVQTAHRERVAPFNERAAVYAETDPDYADTVKGSDVKVSPYQEGFIYESEVGPQLLLYFAQNPKEAAKIGAMKEKSQSKAMLDLEAKFLADATEEGEEEEPAAETPKIPKKTVPPKKASSAPPPTNRLKPAGPAPKTLQELAGPEDRTGVDIEFNSEYERADKARRKT